MKHFLCLLIFTVIFFSFLAAQSTVGIGEVISIESKAGAYTALEKKLITLYNELTHLKDSKASRLRDMLRELDSLKKQRDTEIGELKLGYRCSQCGVFKSEMEKKGENFEAHLKKVNGVPIPAGDEEISAKRTAWTERLALKTVQLNMFRTKEDPAELSRKEEMEKVKASMAKICPELVALSNTYEGKVIAEGKRLHKSWIDNAMSAAASEHIVHDKIFIATGKIKMEEKELREKSQELIYELKKNLDTKLNKQKDFIQQLTQQVTEMQHEMEVKVDEITDILSPKKMEKTSLQTRLRSNLKDSLRKVLTIQLSGLNSEINTLETLQRQTEKSYTDKINEQKLSIRKANDEITNLTLNFPKIQEMELQKLKKQYDDRITQLKVSRTGYESMLPTAHTKFLNLADEARKRLSAFVAIIEAENNRMLSAVRPVNCSIWTQAHLKVSTNFNIDATCMEGLRSKDRSFPGSGMDCTAKWDSYLFIYRPFITGLGNADIQIIKANTSTYWSESIFK